MRVQEIIRGILDMIDHAEKSTDIAHPDGSMPNDEFYDDDVRRLYGAR